MDDRILAIISNTTVVAEAHYHQNCCYLNTKSEEDKNTGKKRINLREFDYAEKESAANQEQLAFIRNNLL